MPDRSFLDWPFFTDPHRQLADKISYWARTVLVPLILFWQLRLWLSTTRGYMYDDPIVYAARDWVSWIAAAFGAAIMVLANHMKILS